MHMERKAEKEEKILASELASGLISVGEYNARLAEINKDLERAMRNDEERRE